jgi:hypothetical protein
MDKPVQLEKCWHLHIELVNVEHDVFECVQCGIRGTLTWTMCSGRSTEYGTHRMCAGAFGWCAQREEVCAGRSSVPLCPGRPTSNRERPDQSLSRHDPQQTWARRPFVYDSGRSDQADTMGDC